MKKIGLSKLMSKIADKPHKERDNKISRLVDRLSTTSLIILLSEIDDIIYLRMYKKDTNAIFRNIMYLFSRLGDGYIWVLVLIVMILIKSPSVYFYFMRTLPGIISCIIIFAYLKNLINRTRPYVKHDKAPIIRPPDRYSFPSGHTMVAFSVVMTFGLQSSHIFIICIVLAILIGLSRIYTGVHYPFDVLASCIVGSIIGICVNVAFYFIFNMPIVNL